MKATRQHNNLILAVISHYFFPPLVHYLVIHILDGFQFHMVLIQAQLSSQTNHSVSCIKYNNALTWHIINNDSWKLEL